MYAHDSNLTLNLLIRIITDTAIKMETVGKTLYLQMDNCIRECKNVYILAICRILVEWNIFTKVRTIGDNITIWGTFPIYTM